MNWSTKLKIALGSAKGFAYLHEEYCNPCFIHRDIKTLNILLDYKFEAKVADFRLAKLSSENCTHVTTRIVGHSGTGGAPVMLSSQYCHITNRKDQCERSCFKCRLISFIGYWHRESYWNCLEYNWWY